MSLVLRQSFSKYLGQTLNSLYSPAWLQTHSNPVSAFQELGLQAQATTTSFANFCKRHTTWFTEERSSVRLRYPDGCLCHQQPTWAVVLLAHSWVSLHKLLIPDDRKASVMRKEKVETGRLKIGKGMSATGWLTAHRTSGCSRYQTLYSPTHSRFPSHGNGLCSSLSP